MDTNEFVKKSILTHGDKYDYSNSVYTNVKDKVIIICKEHGEFTQVYKDHIIGRGCKKCSANKLSINFISNKESFIKKSMIKHGDKYDYSLFIYCGAKEKSVIICKEHGEFLQNPNNHLYGQGCPYCANQVRGDKRRILLGDFIKRASKIHYNKYDYSLVEYNTNKNNIKIICKNHGIFLQTPNNHLSGDGCKKCNISLGELKIIDYLNKNNIVYKHQHKFNDCKFKNKLVYDFYLPDKDICIEFNGIQHYEPIKYFGGISAYEKQVIKDQIKYDYCIKNGIKFIVIKYDSNIENSLTTI